MHTLYLIDSGLRRFLAILNSRKMLAIFILLILPIFFLFLFSLNYYVGNSCFEFSCLDDWIYYGYVKKPEIIKSFIGTYYASRISGIIPGAIICKLWPWNFKDYIPPVVYFFSTITGLYFFLKNTTNKKSALLSVSLLAFYLPFIHATSSYYVDGVCIMYTSLTLLCLSRSIRKQEKISLVLGGFFWGSAITAQIFVSVFTPFVFIIYFFLIRSQKPLNLLNFLIFFSTGLLICLSVFGTLNLYIFKGAFLYFLPSSQWLVSFLKSGSNPWLIGNILNWNLKTWVICLFLAPLFCTIFKIFNFNFRKKENIPYIIFCSILFTYLFLQFFMGQPVLQLEYYTSFSIPFMFLLINQIINHYIHSLSRIEIIRLTIVIFAYILFAITCLYYNQMYFFTLLISMSVFSMLIAYFFIKHYNTFTRALFAFTFLLSSVFLTYSECFYSKALMRVDYSIMNDVNSILDEIAIFDPSFTGKIWFNANNKHKKLFLATAFVLHYLYRTINFSYPSLDPYLSTYELKDGDVIFILDDTNHQINKAISELKNKGLAVKDLHSKTIKLYEDSFCLNYIKLERLD